MNFGNITNTLATLSLLCGVLGILLLTILLVPGARNRIRTEVAGQTRLLLGTAWLVATGATVGSLYYSEVVGFVPCELCWWQRIAMYPLVLVLGVAAVRGDRRVAWYGLPLSVVGLAIALYHILIQFQPTLDVGMCDGGVPCTARYLSVFGFVSIPVMASGGFLLVTGLLAAALLDRRS